MKDPKRYAELAQRLAHLSFDDATMEEAARLVRGMVSAYGESVESYANAVGVSVKTVHRWKKMQPGKPAPLRRHVLAMVQLTEEAPLESKSERCVQESSTKLTQVMLDAVASVYPVRPIKLELLEWLADVQGILGFEMDFPFCVVLLQKREEARGKRLA